MGKKSTLASAKSLLALLQAMWDDVHTHGKSFEELKIKPYFEVYQVGTIAKELFADVVQASKRPTMDEALQVQEARNIRSRQKKIDRQNRTRQNASTPLSEYTVGNLINEIISRGSEAITTAECLLGMQDEDYLINGLRAIGDYEIIRVETIKTKL